MADQRQGGIGWTEETWNPIRGCSRVSAGCRNCYAERQAIRMAGPGQAYEGLVVSGRMGPTWTGQVRLIEELLDQPSKWTRPRRIFVNSMSDLFHEALPDETIFRVFAAMAEAPQHVFQCLTKRSARMRGLMPSIRAKLVDRLNHVWLGVSVEDQPSATQRIPDLLATPAAVRWLSIEPLLGKVDVSSCFLRYRGDGTLQAPFRSAPDWVVVGGESGPGARPMSLQWARVIQRDCEEANIPFFMKQLGDVAALEVGASDRSGKNVSDFPDELQVQEYPA